SAAFAAAAASDAPQTKSVNHRTLLRIPIGAPLDLVVRGVEHDTGFRYTRDLAALICPVSFTWVQPETPGTLARRSTTGFYTSPAQTTLGFGSAASTGSVHPSPL